MSQRVWSNGRLIGADELRVSPFDRGLTVGLGLFETILAVDGRPVFLERHRARHAEGCRRLGWLPSPGEELGESIEKLLEVNGLGVGFARVRWFRTAGGGGLDDPGCGADALTLITAASLAVAPDSVSLTLSPWVRNERSPLAGLKCASYAENLLALSAARASGFDEPLFLNTRGEICETATANVFLVRDGRGFTPPVASGCLPGVARGWLLDSAAETGVSVEEKRLSPEDLEEAGEVFVTSALRGVTPVSRLGDRVWPVPGETTRALRRAWESAIALG